MQSSSGFLLSLDIDRPACWRVSVLVLLGAGLALVACGLSGLAWQARAVVAALSLAAGLWESWRHRPGAANYLERIRVSPQGMFSLGRAKGREGARGGARSGPGDHTVDVAGLIPARLVHWWVLPHLAIGLSFADGHGRRAQAILFRDRLPADGWRRLLVRLKHGVAPVRGRMTRGVGA